MDRIVTQGQRVVPVTRTANLYTEKGWGKMRVYDGEDHIRTTKAKTLDVRRQGSCYVVVYDPDSECGYDIFDNIHIFGGFTDHVRMVD